MMFTDRKIEPIKNDWTLEIIVEKIEKGYELQGINQLELEKDARLKYIDCIILKPSYQREYRFTITDESSLIESIMIGIPIPPVFLCTARLKGASTLNVVDGQHRLYAIYRFIKNEFRLSNLPLLTSYENMTFSELTTDLQEKILSATLSSYVFRGFPDKKFELEIFSRYNKGTKALTQQELRNAVYSSVYNDFVTEFVEKIYKNESGEMSALKEAYNVTKDRFLKKKVHEGIFSIMYVLEKGINEDFKNSTVYADEYMKMKSSSPQIANDITALKHTIEVFDNFNNWIMGYTSLTKYPFSKEIYGVSSKSYKFQTSIALILAGVYKKLRDKNKNNIPAVDLIQKKMKDLLQNSYLEDQNYSASSTNPKELKNLVDTFDA